MTRPFSDPLPWQMQRWKVTVLFMDGRRRSTRSIQNYVVFTCDGVSDCAETSTFWISETVLHLQYFPCSARCLHVTPVMWTKWNIFGLFSCLPNFRNLPHLVKMTCFEYFSFFAMYFFKPLAKIQTKQPQSASVQLTNPFVTHPCLQLCQAPRMPHPFQWLLHLFAVCRNAGVGLLGFWWRQRSARLEQTSPC